MHLRLASALCCLCLSAALNAREPVRHSFLSADSSQQRIALIEEDGSTRWERKIGPLHDLHVLPNGNVLFQENWTRVVEVDPATNELVWEYDSATRNGNSGKKVEVHAFQRLANGHTMIAESGVARIIEVNVDGEIQHTVPLQVSEPHPHRDTRLVRKLPSGNYLVCHEGDGLVREYLPSGDSVWEYAVPLFGRDPKKGHGPEAFGNLCFAALRRSNGNSLISTGNGHGVIEVTPQGEIVWKLAQRELPDIVLAWVTTLQELPNGNLVIGNCHAGPDQPQMVEVDREKRVVWTFHDFERFGNATTNTQILTTNGEVIAGTLGMHR